MRFAALPVKTNTGYGHRDSSLSLSLSVYIYIYCRVVRYRLAVEMRQTSAPEECTALFSSGRAGNCGIGPATVFHSLVLVFESVLRKSPVDGVSIHGSFVHSTKYYK